MDSFIAGLVGAGLLAAFSAASYLVGRKIAHGECAQLRTTVSELMQVRLQTRNQIEAARDAVGRLITDPRTAPHDRMALEDHIAPLLVQRNETGQFKKLDTERFWKLGR